MNNQQTPPHPPTPTAAEKLVEVLDVVVSSNAVNRGPENQYFRILRRVSAACGILPKSYYLVGVNLNDTVPYTSAGFADIWNTELDGQQVSIKAFRPQPKANFDKIRQLFYREIIMWKYVEHPNVVPFLGISEMLKPFCIINPRMSNGDILEYLSKNEGVNRLQLLTQAARGLEYLHSRKIVHGDVNPSTILIDASGTALLADFGIAGIIIDPVFVESYGTTPSKPVFVRYMAPELLNPSHFELSNGNPTRESDVYALSMTIYEVLTGILPYGRSREGTIIFQVADGARPPFPKDTRWVTDQIWNMITACWDQKRERRWKMSAVCCQLSASSIQDIAEGGRDNHSTSQAATHVERAIPFSEVQTATPSSGVTPLHFRQTIPGERLSVCLGEPDNEVRKSSGSNSHSFANPVDGEDDRGQEWNGEDTRSTPISGPDALSESLESWYGNADNGAGGGESSSDTWDEPPPPPPAKEAVLEPAEKLEGFCGNGDQGTASVSVTRRPELAERGLPDLPDHDHQQSPPKAPPRPSNASTKHGGSTHSRAAPLLPSLPRTTSKRSVFSALPCTTRDSEETEGFQRQVPKSLKSASWGCKWTRTVFDTLRAAFKRTRKPPSIHERSSR